MRAIDMTEEQVVSLHRLCKRYNTEFNANSFWPIKIQGEETGYIQGDIAGKIIVGISIKGEISS